MFSLGIVMLMSYLTFGQEITITGTVYDNQRLPVPGANVVIKGTKIGTQTDFDGTYSIKTKKGDVLVFSFIGMESRQETVKDSKIIIFFIIINCNIAVYIFDVFSFWFYILIS